MSEVLSSEFDVYRAVTDRIIEAIEVGAERLVMPWHGLLMAQGLPTNASTHFAYRGINILSLWAEASLRGFGSSYWASQSQWKRKRRRVVSGEKGALVVFYKLLGQEVTDGGEPPPQAQWLVKLSRVFNEDQLEDRRFFGRPPPPLPQIVAEAETVVASTRALIEHGCASTRYRIKDDVIEMPDRAMFLDSSTSVAVEAYFASVFGELVRWTGAPARLNRDLGSRFGDLAGAAEALVAEIGGALLCAHVEMANEPRPGHAHFVADWLELLRRDQRAIFTIAQLARGATHYVLRFSEREPLAA